MIRLGTRPPATVHEAMQALAAALNGEVIGPNCIRVGTHLVTTSPLGVVRVGRHPLGLWRDETASLVERFRAVA